MNDKDLELYTKLSQLQWLLQRHHMQHGGEHGPAADPTKGQGRVLAILKLQPELSTKDLTYLLGIRQQSLNELLNKLEKNGFVTREPSEADRRVMLVKLTEKGKDTQQPRQPDFSEIFSCLSQEEQERLGEYLDRVIASLKAQFSDEDREQFDHWMRAARSRLGNDFFERLMDPHRGHHPLRDDPRFQGGRPGWERHPHRPGFDGMERDGYGSNSHNIPGAERFDPNYDGPVPHGREGHPHNEDGRPAPPPPSPKSPHDPEEE